MSRKSKLDQGMGARARLQEAPQAADNGLTMETTLGQVRRCLEAGAPQEALSLIGRCPVKSDRLSNAAAVCQIRLGRPEVALEILRPLVLQGSYLIRPDAPPAFRLNLAAALLASGNLDGFLSTLGDVDDQAYPVARKYADAYRLWKSELTMWDRLKSALLCRPSRVFRPDFPLGELD